MSDLKDKSIKLLTSIYGYEIGTIVTPDFTLYPQFKAWAECESTITESGKAVKICEFVEKEAENLSVLLKKASDVIGRIKDMQDPDEIEKFIEGETRPTVVEVANLTITALRGNHDAENEKTTEQAKS